MPSAEFLKRYRDLRPIGQGGMGSVFKATQASLSRPVAIKFMHGELGASPEFRRRFLDEGQLTARLEHPSVVRVYEYGLDGDTPYLVYEFVDGEDLRSRLGRAPALEREQSLDWMSQVLDGLAAAHELGIVHRDVKPENILLGTDGRVVLADFGLAREADGAQRTAAGLVLGTPAYVAPEQILGQRATARTDVYSAASVIYELLGGHPPFEAKTPADLLARKLREEPPSLARGPRGLPAPLDDVLLRALSREPEARYLHAGLFREALERARSKGVPAPQPGATRAVRSLARQAAATVATPGPPPRAAVPPRPAAPRPMALILAVLAAFGIGAGLGGWLSGLRAAVPRAPSQATQAPPPASKPGALAVPTQPPFEQLVEEARQTVDAARLDRAMATFYPSISRSSRAAGTMRSFWNAAGGNALAGRIVALTPRVSRALADPAVPVRERGRLYRVFEPLARVDATLDFLDATSLFGWEELTASAASQLPCTESPDSGGWTPVQVWPDLNQVLVCDNTQVMAGERDFWNLLLGLSWLQKEPARELTFDYRSPPWWENRPVQLLVRATFLGGESLLRLALTPGAAGAREGGPGGGASSNPELTLLLHPCHRKYTHVGVTGTTREALRDDASGSLVRLGPGLVRGNRDYRAGLQIVSGPPSGYRHKMIVLGLWTRPEPATAAGRP
jgi:hypothetical protein